MKQSERQVKNRASARRSKQRKQKKLEDLFAGYERLTLLDTTLHSYVLERVAGENAKVVSFNVGVMERFLGKHETKKTQA